MAIMEKVRAWMEEEDLTYEELGKRIGWSKQNLWRMMHVGTCPNFESVVKVAKALGYEMTVSQNDDFTGVVDLEELYRRVEEQQVSFDVVEDLLNAIGYDVQFKKTR